MLAFELIVIDERQRVKIFAATHHTLCVLAKYLSRVVAVDMLSCDVGRAPLEGADHSVFVALRKMSLARVNQTFEQVSRRLSTYDGIRTPLPAKHQS